MKTTLTKTKIRNTNLRAILLLIILFIMSNVVITLAQIDSPGVRWKRWDWAPIHPVPSLVTTPPLKNAPNQEQEESSEDWWYDHENSYDAVEI